VITGSALICDAGSGVSTGSGSDRVSRDHKIELAATLTRSLPLPVQTSAIKLGSLPITEALQRRGR
jgi:hypothetical protein